MRKIRIEEFQRALPEGSALLYMTFTRKPGLPYASVYHYPKPVPARRRWRGSEATPFMVRIGHSHYRVWHIVIDFRAYAFIRMKGGLHTIKLTL